MGQAKRSFPACDAGQIVISMQAFAGQTGMSNAGLAGQPLIDVGIRHRLNPSMRNMVSSLVEKLVLLLLQLCQLTLGVAEQVCAR